MHQEIVIGPSFIDFLDKHYVPFDYNNPGADLLTRVQEDIIFLDEDRVIDNAIEGKILELNDEAIMTLWTAYVPMLTKKRTPITNIKDDSIDVTEAYVSMNTLDRLNIKKEINNNLIKEIKKAIGKKFSPTSIHDYLNPSLKNIIIFDGRRINLKKGNSFPFFKYLKVCFRNTKHVEIIDGYLVQKIPKENLISIIRRIPHDSKILIKTLSDKARNMHKFGKDKYHVNDVLDEIKTKYPRKNIELKTFSDKKKIHDRAIICDNWQIYMGRGLDFFNLNSIIKYDTYILFSSR